MSTTAVVLLMCAPAAVGLIVMTACWQPAYKRQMALPTSHAFAGEVVKRWHVEEEGDYLSIDDGSSPTAVTFSIEGNTYWNIGLGDKLQVTVNPRLGFLKNIEVTATASSGPYPA